MIQALNPVPMIERGKQIIRIERPTPKLGGKAIVIDRKGIFIFEEGPGTLVTIAVTHAGAGTILAIDGIPDDKGFLESFAPNPDDASQDLTAPGVELFHASPVVMGSWMLNAGFHHGLTLKVQGGHESVSAIFSIVWQPYAKRS